MPIGSRVNCLHCLSTLLGDINRKNVKLWDDMVKSTRSKFFIFENQNSNWNRENFMMREGVFCTIVIIRDSEDLILKGILWKWFLTIKTFFLIASLKYLIKQQIPGGEMILAVKSMDLVGLVALRVSSYFHSSFW